MPDWSREISRRLSSLNLDSAREIEIVEELSQHLDDRYDELISGGTTDEDARRDVLMELHDEDLFAQERPRMSTRGAARTSRPGSAGHGFFASLGQDLRYALRQIQRNPGFALVAIITLGPRHWRQHGDFQCHRQRAARAISL